MALINSFPVDFSNTTMNEDLVENITQCPETTTEWMLYNVVPVYILIISALGIVLNTVVLLVFFLHKKERTVPEIYLSNLAAADLLLMCFLPFWAVAAAKKFNWIFGSHMCRLVHLSIVMNINISIYFLILVSIDRFSVLVYPLSHTRMRSRKFAHLGCLLVWCFGLILGIPTVVCREVIHNNVSNMPLCSFTCSLTVYLTKEALQTVFCFIIPVVIVSYCNVKIIQTLKNRPVEGVEIQKMKRRVTILVLLVLAALFCWIPFRIMRVIDQLIRTKIITGKDRCEVKRVFNIFLQTVIYLAFFNSVLNPILHVITTKDFRTKTCEVFKRCTKARASVI